MTKKTAAAIRREKAEAKKAEEAKAEEALEALAEQDPDDIEITLKADPNTLALPECEQHRFQFLRTAKIRGNKSTEGTFYRRIDTFYCFQCLRYTTVAREERAKIQPEWFMGN